MQSPGQLNPHSASTQLALCSSVSVATTWTPQPPQRWHATPSLSERPTLLLPEPLNRWSAVLGPSQPLERCAWAVRGGAGSRGFWGSASNPSIGRSRDQLDDWFDRSVNIAAPESITPLLVGLSVNQSIQNGRHGKHADNYLCNQPPCQPNHAPIIQTHVAIKHQPINQHMDRSPPRDHALKYSLATGR